MSRPWVVRAVALLLVLVGLQAGSFHDLDTSHERYYGTEDYSAAVRPEARKSEGVPVEPPSLPNDADRPAIASRASASPVAVSRGRAAPARRLHPDPTGPPLT